MSFDFVTLTNTDFGAVSQSLSIRAMSFDQQIQMEFRLQLQSQSLSIRAMSFDIDVLKTTLLSRGLNPFRSGRCLSTILLTLYGEFNHGLNPFRSGRCLSTKTVNTTDSDWGKSQSLSIRAMSFDKSMTA